MRSGTPAFCAFATFEPGLSPTKTPVVFFETESETLAPSASSAAFASSRVNDSSVPVITYWLPVSGPSTGCSSSPTSKRSPSSRSSATSARFCSSENHSAIASARSGPIPSTSWMSSWLASSSRSTVAEVAREVPRRHPADVGDVEPEEDARERLPPSTAAIASTAFRAEISP